MKKLKIFILIGFVTIGLLVLTGCTTSINADNKRFIEIDVQSGHSIIVDKNTKVMYLTVNSGNGFWSKNGITVLVNKDGKPLLYE